MRGQLFITLELLVSRHNQNQRVKNDRVFEARKEVFVQM